MPDHYGGNIRIGGRIRKDRVKELLDAIRAAFVYCDYGDPLFEPETAKDLSAAIQDGRLWLCDEEASYGAFPKLEETCRNLGLPYTRWSEGYCEYDPEIVDWRPGMHEPLVRVGSNASDAAHVPVEQVRKALRHLEANRAAKAKALLRSLCPDISRLPPFKIVWS